MYASQAKSPSGDQQKMFIRRSGSCQQKMLI